MKILVVGDVTSPRASEELSLSMWKLREQTKADLVIVNAENAGMIIGPTPQTAQRLLDSGVDVLTGGNHLLQNYALSRYLDDNDRILRPLNYPSSVPGSGYTILDCLGFRVLVMNVLGRVHMEPSLDSPFFAVDKVLEREKNKFDIAILDVHAEAGGEKLALAYHLDGRVNIVFGTHTHVPTADARILPKGTAYLTDVGMCGAEDGIFGLSTEIVLQRNLTSLPLKLTPSLGAIFADVMLFDYDTAHRRVRHMERLRPVFPL